jgi:hypothetical protein
METNTRTVFSNSLIYGLITAAISIVFAVFAYILDIPQQSPIMYFSFLILLAGMIYGTVQFKNKFLGGYISFGKAFVSGFLIVLIAAVIASLYSYVFLTFIDPTYLDKIVEQALEKAEESMIEKGLSDEQMEPGLAMTRKFLSPGIMSVFAVIYSALLGAVCALIAAAVIKKEDKSLQGQF